MSKYQYYLLSYRPTVKTGEQLVVGLIFQTDHESPFLVMPDSSDRLSRVWTGFEVSKYVSLSGWFADGMRARLAISKDISKDLTAYQNAGGCFVFSNIRAGIHPEPVERLSQLIDEYLLKNL